MDNTSHVGIFHSSKHIKCTHVACPWQDRQLTYKPFLPIVSAAHSLNQWAFLSSNMSVKSIGSAFQMSSESIGLFISLLLPLSSFLGSVTWLSYFHSCVFPSILLPTKSIFQRAFEMSFCCYCSVAKLCLTLCDPMDCSMPGSSSFIIFWSLLRFMSIELVMLSNHFILRHLLLLQPSIFPGIKVFSSESALHIRWPNKVLELQLQHQSFPWIFRVDFL